MPETKVKRAATEPREGDEEGLQQSGTTNKKPRIDDPGTGQTSVRSMAKKDDGPCQVILHFTPLQASRSAQQLAENGVTLPHCIQHWALVFLWEDSDQALRVEGVEDNGKCIVRVNEMNFQDGLSQPGTKFQCGSYQLSFEQVKSTAEEVGADPPDYHQLRANCQTTAKKILEKLDISVDVETAEAEAQRLGPIVGEQVLEHFMDPATLAAFK